MGSRVLLDANLLISYLLSPKNQSIVIESLFDRIFAMEITLVLPTQVLTETFETIASKPYLAERISTSMIETFQRAIVAVADVTSDRPEVVSLVRDPKDDYLIAHAIHSQVDYLVTGDRDLLVLGDVLAPLKIRTPQAFLDELDSTSGGS